MWVPMTLIDLERRDAMGQFFPRISEITLVGLPFRLENKFGWVTRGGVFAATPPPNGQGPSISRILGPYLRLCHVHCSSDIVLYAYTGDM